MSHGKNINISDEDGNWHLCVYPYNGWPTVSSEWSDARRGPQNEGCQSTNLNRRPCRRRPEVDFATSGLVSTGVPLLNVKPGLLLVLPVFLPGGNSFSTGLPSSSSPGSGAGVLRQLETGCSRPVLPGPETKRLVFRYLRVAGFRLKMFGDFFCSVPTAHTAPRRLGHRPKNWLSGIPFIASAVCCGTQSYAVSVTVKQNAMS